MPFHFLSSPLIFAMPFKRKWHKRILLREFSLKNYVLNGKHGPELALKKYTALLMHQSSVQLFPGNLLGRDQVILFGLSMGKYPIGQWHANGDNARAPDDRQPARAAHWRSDQ